MSSSKNPSFDNDLRPLDSAEVIDISTAVREAICCGAKLRINTFTIILDRAVEALVELGAHAIAIEKILTFQMNSIAIAKAANIFKLLVDIVSHKPFLRGVVQQILTSSNILAECKLNIDFSDDLTVISIARIFSSLRDLRRLQCLGAHGSLHENSYTLNLATIHQCIYAPINCSYCSWLRFEAVNLFSELINLAPTIRHGLALRMSDFIKKFDQDNLNNFGTDLSNESIDYHHKLNLTVTIGGQVFESCRERSKPWAHKAILTKTTTLNFSRLAEAVISMRPILVCGDVGSGKSFLIREMADSIGIADTLVEIHIDDQTDSKALIGAYVCSDVPGEFVWKNGILTEAVVHGHWIVIENLDSVPLEILASIVSLMEFRQLSLPGQEGALQAHPRFRLIATSNSQAIVRPSVESISDPKSLTSLTFTLPNLSHLSHMWHPVFMDTLSVLEIKEIIVCRYPTLLPSVVDSLISMYDIFSESSQNSHDLIQAKELAILRRVRPFSCRDVFKVAYRINNSVANHFNKVSQMITHEQSCLCFIEAVEVFASAIREKKLFESVAKLLGHCWGIFADEVLQLTLNAHPQIHGIGSSYISIGRVSVSVPSTVDADFRIQSFAFTAYSARILEKIAACVNVKESVLLVGETGAGKTSSVQELANIYNKKLLVQNLSLSTDSSDLLGGYRPVNIKQLLKPYYEDFVVIFQETFSTASNADFLLVISQSFRSQDWKKLVKAFQKASASALKKLMTVALAQSDLVKKWQLFLDRANKLEVSLPRLEKGFGFSFVDGLLVEAMRFGHWILLDEVNLASPETLQGLAGILEGQSFALTEKGGLETVTRHPEFRVFAAMNPPTDVGKKELPAMLRARFTEIYVEELLDPQDLKTIVHKYITDASDALCQCVVDAYLQCRTLAEARLVDSSGTRPHYSLRSLTRSLQAAKRFMSLGFRSTNRAVFEGFVLNFHTKLGVGEHRDFLWKFLREIFGIKDNSKELDKPTERPGGKLNADEWVLIKPFWLRTGSKERVDWAERDSTGIVRFVITKSIGDYIRSLCAGISCGVSPILLEGPTSVGKTTMIEYLAARSGNKCIRINNHEHTDVQEYIGGYSTDANGQLVFKDGSLVEALRNGYWIILDELNLAPSDVLEALNRLLDDNRELLIPETGELVHPAKGFQLFATQNPSGIYGGRKPLSRAFRNRFIEIVVNDLPTEEVEEIVCSSCGIPKKFSKMLVMTMQELQTHRQQSSLFQGKTGSITLRDLIKWGKRRPDSALAIAQEGFMLLAEKLRNSSDKSTIVSVLDKVCGISLDVNSLYNKDSEKALELSKIQGEMREGVLSVEGVSGIANTWAMRRMWTLASKGLRNSEPILLVGGTGTGKTTLCQLYAASNSLPVRIVSCHQSIESSDIIGSLRPIRGRESLMKKIITLLYEINTINSSNTLSDSINEIRRMESEGDYSVEIQVRIAITEVQKFIETVPDVADHPQALKKLKLDDSTALVSISFLEMAKALELLWQRYNSLFEWQDGPLVQAMKAGEVFVLDEINLADDAVIERLNSVLESGREITLAEKSGGDGLEKASEKIIAHPNFKFLATMNPGGDYGKRELSPALRSRFTEIWIPDFSFENRDDILSILQESLNFPGDTYYRQSVASIMLEFMLACDTYCNDHLVGIVKSSVRDLIAWAKFVDYAKPIDELSLYKTIYHGAFMLILDGFGVATSLTREVILNARMTLSEKLLLLLPAEHRSSIRDQCQLGPNAVPMTENGIFHLNGLSIPLGCLAVEQTSYVLTSANVKENIYRILRAAQLRRPILLEGAPGVGKSSIIATLAAVTGNRLVRINLSEQSDISDLLGTDLPVEAGSSQMKFAWNDGVFLRAMKAGDWVLLDELNLAPQSVLEGLNSCFDHREEVMIPEIGQVVHMAPSFRIFCSQNPLAGGGGRKGLPQSLLSRFSRVYVEPMSVDDMTFIALESLKKINLKCPFELSKKLEAFVPLMVKFVHQLHIDVTINCFYGHLGSPWEFNLRDVFRWIDYVFKAYDNGIALQNDFQFEGEVVLRAIADGAACTIQSRFRSFDDREAVARLFEKIMGFQIENSDLLASKLPINFSSEMAICGSSAIKVIGHTPYLDYTSLAGLEGKYPVLGSASRSLEFLCHAISINSPVLLVGPYGSGKRRIARHLAAISGNALIEISASSSTDSSDLIGTYEQANAYRHITLAVQMLEAAVLGVSSIALKYKFDQIDLQAVHAMVESFDLIKLTCKEVVFNYSLLQSAGSKLIASINASILAVEKILSNQLCSEFATRGTALLENAKIELSRSVSIGSETGSFEWIDGIVVKAAERGQWLLIDNVNLCSGSVLDRLNSLLEPGGSLVLAENGTGRVVTRHKNFRVFLSMVPSRGEISRAMRNRCVEICMIPEQIYEAALSHHFMNHSTTDVERVNDLLNSATKMLNAVDVRDLPAFKLYSYALERSSNGRREILPKHRRDEPASCFASLKSIFLSYMIRLLSGTSANEACSWLFESIIEAKGKHASSVLLKKSPVVAAVLNSVIGETSLSDGLILRAFLAETLNFCLTNSFCEALLFHESFQRINFSDVFNKLKVLTLKVLPSMDLTNEVTQRSPMTLKLIEIIAVRRLQLLMKEEENRAVIAEYSLVQTGSTWLDGWVFGCAASSGVTIPSSKDEMVIAALFQLFQASDLFSQHLLQIFSTQKTTFIYEISCKAYRLRDKFSEILSAIPGGSLSVPWNELSVLLRWWKKLLQSIKPSLTVNSYKPIVSLVNTSEDQILRFEKTVDKILNRSFSSRRMLLWEERGHSKVPNTLAKWGYLKSILQTLRSLDNSMPYASFCEMRSDSTPVSPRMLYQRQQTSDLCKEAVGVLCTFYCCHVDEFRDRNNDLSVLTLIDPLRIKVESQISDVIGRADDLSLDIVDTLSQGKFKSRLHSELDLVAGQHAQAGSEYIVVRALFLMSSILVKFLRIFEANDLEEVSALVLLLQKYSALVLSLSINSSLFPLELLTETQGLLWYSEMCREKNFEPNALSSLGAYARIFSITINNSLLRFTAYNSFNVPSNISFEIKTLLLLSGSAGTCSPIELPSIEKLLYPGVTRQLQPFFLESSLRLVDSRVLFPSWSIGELASRLMSSPSRVSISAVQQARIVSKQLYSRHLLASTVDNLGQNALDTDTNYGFLGRADLIADLIISALKSCRDYYPGVNFDSVVCNGSLTVLATRLNELYNQIIAISITDGSEKALQEMLISALKIVKDEHFLRNPLEDMHKCGKVLSIVGLCYLTLVAPRTPVDPTSLGMVKSKFLKRESDELKAMVFAKISTSAVCGEKFINSDLCEISEQLTANQTRINKLASKIVHRPEDAPSFSEMFRAMSEAMTYLLNRERIEDLLRIPDKSSISDLEMYVSKEVAWQSSVLALYEQINSDYSAYADVTSTFIAGLQILSQGVRMAVSANVRKLSVIYQKSSSATLSGLFTFPFLSSSNLENKPEDIQANLVSEVADLVDGKSALVNDLLDIICSDSYITHSERRQTADAALSNIFLIYGIVKINYLTGNSIVSPSSPSVRAVSRQVLDHFTNLFIAVTEAVMRKKEADAAAYAYKVKDENFVSDDAAEEEAAMRMAFPDHLKAFESLSLSGGDQENPLQTSSVPSATSELQLFDDMACLTIVSHHSKMSFALGMEDSRISFLSNPYTIFSRRSAHKHQRRTNLLKHLSLAGALLNPLLRRIDNPNDSSFRGMSLAITATLLPKSDSSTTTIFSNVDRDLELLLSEEVASELADFQTGSNMSETIKVRDILLDLINRSAEVLTLYPDNEVLLQLCKITAVTLDFHVNTPLGRILASLELILRKAQEWESVASKQLSFVDVISKIKSVIGHLREIELKSWEQLLRNKEESYSRAATKSWFHIVNVLHSPELAIFEESSNNHSDWISLQRTAPAWLLTSTSLLSEESLFKAYNVVDTYLRSSVVGEFPMKLHIVRSFALEALHREQGEALGSMLASIWLYYSEFLPIVREFQLKQSGPIEQKLKEEVKMGKWDRISAYSVIEHSERIHRKLHRLIRSYQTDALDVSVDVLLRKEFLADVPDFGKNDAAVPCSEVPSLSLMFPLTCNKSSNVFSEGSCDTPLPMVDIEDKLIMLSKSLRPAVTNHDPDDSSSFLARSENLAHRFNKYLQLLFRDAPSRIGNSAATLAEELCDDIFERIESLRAEHSPKPMKHRAVLDLLSTLKEHGFSKLQAQPSAKNMFVVLSTTKCPIAAEILVNTLWQSSSNASALARAEHYFQRNLLEISQVREFAGTKARSKDLSDREVSTLLAYGESLFVENLKLRAVLKAGIDEFKEIIDAIDKTKSRSQMAEADESVICETQNYIRTASAILDSLVDEVLMLVQESSAVGAISSDLDRSPVSDDDVSSLVKSVQGLCLAFKPSAPPSSTQVFGSLYTSNRPEFSLSSYAAYLSQYLINAISARDILATFIPQLGRLVSFEVAEILLVRTDEAIERVRKYSTYFTTRVSESKSAVDKYDTDDSSLHLNECIGHCLVAVQKLNKIHAFTNDADYGEKGTEMGQLRGVFGESITSSATTSLVGKVHLAQLSIASLQIPKILSSLRAAFSSMDTKTISQSLPLVLPFLEHIQLALVTLLEDLSAASKATNKLLYVFLRVVRNLLSKGFCVADESEEDSGEGGQDGKFESDGTGMGAGDGSKDVSNEIDNEDQLMGLKDEDKDDDPKDSSQKKKPPLTKEESQQGVEMSQDFEGETYDMASDEEQKDDSQSENDDEDDEKSIDREMGDADAEDVVDEKQWNDDEDDLDQEQDEDVRNDSKVKGDVLDEMHTKDNDDSENGDKDESTDEDKDNRKMSAKDQEKELDSEEKEERNDNDNDEQVNNEAEKDDSYRDIPPQDEGTGGGEDDDGGEEDDTEAELGKETEVEGSPEEGEDLPDNMQLGDDDVSDGDNKEPSERTDEDSDANDEESADGSVQQAGDEHDNPSASEPEPEPEPETPGEQDVHDGANNTLDDKSKSYPKAFGVQSAGASQAMMNTDDQTQQSESDDAKDAAGEQKNTASEEKHGSTSQDSSSGALETGSARGAPQTNDGPSKTEDIPNPLREKGDLLKKWHRRLNMTADRSLDDEDGMNADEQDTGAGLFQDAPKESNVSAQVLGQQSEEEVSRLPQEGEMPDEQDLGDNMDDSSQPKGEDIKDIPSPTKKRKLDESSSSPSKNLRRDIEENVEEPPSDDESPDTEPMPSQHVNPQETKNQLVINTSNISLENLDDMSDDNFTEHVTQNNLGAEQLLGLTESRLLWQQHKRLTEAPSARLCEELRLLLEPTLAVRLQGDYRTGKRINMRKVISYIASGYRKDKIWLRRTKPAKRDYRVLIMIDNSRSMDSAGPLTLSALATMATALTRLEVGELCIAKFAETVKVVHSFGQPFDDEAGTRLFQQFHFSSNQTRLGNALSGVVDIFESVSARASSSMSLQLCFLVTDARIDSDDRAQLRKTVSDLMQKNILVVLLVIDVNANPMDSIFNTRIVEFRDAKVSTSSYLDNFPFPFYVTVQSLASLPEVVIGALKQWFETVAVNHV